MSSTRTAATTAEQEWQAWRARREADLARPHGWLSLTALHWLGPDPSVLPGLPGVWWQDGTAIWTAPGDDPVTRDAPVTGDAPGPLTVDGAPVREAVAVLDGDGPSRTVRAGELLVEPLLRGEVWGVRVRDPRARTRTEFDGVPAFDYDPAWVVHGWFEPFSSGPRVTATGSVADGIGHTVELAGLVRFTIDGHEHSLQVGTGERPTVVFRDATSGIESYPALRFVPATVFGEEAVIDFNRAVNPPCAFTDFGTCPLPPPGNTLDVPVRAGERAPSRLVPG